MMMIILSANKWVIQFEYPNNFYSEIWINKVMKWTKQNKTKKKNLLTINKHEIRGWFYGFLSRKQKNQNKKTSKIKTNNSRYLKNI